jgi:hypothetical protein
MMRFLRHPVFPSHRYGARPLALRLRGRFAIGPPDRKAADAAGFTIVEALIGVVILTASIGVLAALTARQWSSSADVDVLDRVESAVARDLGWLKTYATYWRMTSGPYNITCTQAGFGNSCTAFVSSRFGLEYAPDEARCATATGLADDFVTAAGSVTLNPARPFTVASGATTLGVSGLPSGMSLTRTITTGNNIVYLSYSLTGANAATYNFRREAALRPEASGWCP